MMRRGAKRPRFSIDGQPVFENEDSSNQSGLGIMDFDDNSLSQQNETSTNSSDQHHFPQNQFVPDRSRRIQRSSLKPSNDDNANLNASLDHLLRLLLQKDREGFFQYPVTDQVGSHWAQRSLCIFSIALSFIIARTWLLTNHYSPDGLLHHA